MSPSGNQWGSAKAYNSWLFNINNYDQVTMLGITNIPEELVKYMVVTTKLPDGLRGVILFHDRVTNRYVQSISSQMKWTPVYHSTEKCVAKYKNQKNCRTVLREIGKL